jgi:fructose-1,6-bisphosphatase I
MDHLPHDDGPYDDGAHDRHDGATLDDHLAGLVAADPGRRAVAATVAALARATLTIADGLARRRPGEAAARQVADAAVADAAATAPVRRLWAVDGAHAADGTPDAPFDVTAVALDGDPATWIAGSGGSLFGVLTTGPAVRRRGRDLGAALLAVYGPVPCLALTVGAGTILLSRPPGRSDYVVTVPRVAIPRSGTVLSVDASRSAHWEPAVAAYVQARLAAGPEGRSPPPDLRWTGAPVADVLRLLIAGGVHLDPADVRPTYRAGRSRLAHEAWPAAFLVEQAGGAASTGHGPVLDVGVDMAQDGGARWRDVRTPLVLGLPRDVAEVERLTRDPFPLGARSPLFGRRGLFRA